MSIFQDSHGSHAALDRSGGLDSIVPLAHSAYPAAELPSCPYSFSDRSLPFLRGGENVRMEYELAKLVLLRY